MEHLYAYKTIKGTPRDNNRIESFFGDLKAHLGIHKGLKIQIKMKLFRGIFIYLKIQKFAVVAVKKRCGFLDDFSQKLRFAVAA